jgi:hypothetical protein
MRSLDNICNLFRFSNQVLGRKCVSLITQIIRDDFFSFAAEYESGAGKFVCMYTAANLSNLRLFHCLFQANKNVYLFCV